jgi:nucleoside-diphosphate-sugar epimerase
MAMVKGTVGVTGAGGFLASWVVKLLLFKDYSVHGTVRDPSDQKKYAHLNELEKSSDNLKLFKADLLDYSSLLEAFTGCDGVFHVASPVPSIVVPNPEVEVLEPAIQGTLNVLKACVQANVKRVVFVSSGASVVMNPNWPKDQVMDESCWSDAEYCRSTKNWYCLSKTEAEREAFEFAKKNGLDIVSVCPFFIMGPVLQSTMNASTMFLVKVLKEGSETMENKGRQIVDVRDVSEGLLLAYEKPEAEGRYIAMSHVITTRDMVEKLQSLYPNYNYPKSFTDGTYSFSTTSERLQKLGWSYRPIEETLFDSVESYKKAGFLD